MKFFTLRLGVLILVTAMSSVAQGQLARPAAEYHSLLNMRFSEDSGRFLIEGLQIVFPPGGDEQATLTVNRSSGEEVLSLRLRSESYLHSPLFGNLVPSDEPVWIKLGQSGDYVFTIKVADSEITRLPFTLNVEPDGDPFDPPKKFSREGPWRDLAYFSVPLDNLNQSLDFNWWMSLRELPIGMTNPLVTIHLIRGSREIARSRDRVALSSVDWQFFTSELIQNTRDGPQHLTMRELAKRDGDYLLIIKANETPIKSFRVEVKGGRLQRPDQSRLDFEPHVDFISPRLMDISARSGAHYLMRDVYWVRRAAVTARFAPDADAK